MTANGKDDWYFRVGTLEMGPVRFQELIQLASAQRITADDQVKLGTNGKWRQAGSIGRLMAVLPFPTPIVGSKQGMVAVVGSTTPRGELQSTGPITLVSQPRVPSPALAPSATAQQTVYGNPPAVEPPTRTPPRPVASVSTYRADGRATNAYRYQRPTAAKIASKPAGPGLIDKLKDLVAGEFGPHAIGVAVAIVFLVFWYFPRGPVRPVAVHPVKGSIVMDGQPLPNAAVVLHPVVRSKKMPANLQPRGKAAPDGTFALGTFDPSDGAPDGEFVATVFLVEESVSNGEKNFSDNLLPAVYGDPETSPFKVKITSATKVLEPLQLTRQ